MAIGSGVLLPAVAENPTFPILSALAYTTGLGYRPTCDMGSRPPWTDFHKNLQGGRGPWRNQSLQVWLQYFRGFQIYRGSKFPFSHWLCWSSLQQCCRYRAACDSEQICAINGRHLGFCRIRVLRVKAVQGLILSVCIKFGPNPSKNGGVMAV